MSTARSHPPLGPRQPHPRERRRQRRGSRLSCPTPSPERHAGAGRCNSYAPWIERRQHAVVARAALRGCAERPEPCRFLGEDLTLIPEAGRDACGRGAATSLLVPPGSAATAIERYYRRGARARSRRAWTPPAPAPAPLHGPDHPWPEHALGLLLLQGRDVVQLAAAAGTPGNPGRVIEHEVCHLEVMDHSPRFWRLLESRVPDWRSTSPG